MDYKKTKANVITRRKVILISPCNAGTRFDYARFFSGYVTIEPEVDQGEAFRLLDDFLEEISKQTSSAPVRGLDTPRYGKNFNIFSHINRSVRWYSIFKAKLFIFERLIRLIYLLHTLIIWYEREGTSNAQATFYEVIKKDYCIKLILTKWELS